MSEIFLDLEIGLNTTLAQVTGTHVIVWTNDVEFKPTLKNTYYVPRIASSNAEMLSADGIQMHRGTYEVSIYMAMSAQGSRAMLQEMLKVYNEFMSIENHRILVNDSEICIQEGTQSEVGRDGNWLTGTVLITFMCVSY